VPQYLAPGVYVEEVDTGIKTIEGVSTSVAGMVGATMRGPIRGLPQLVTSFADFDRLFGGYFPPGAGFLGHRFLPYAVSGFFTNGGHQLYVMRVANGVSAARKQTKAGVITQLNQPVNVGAATLKPETVLGIQAGTKIQIHMVTATATYDSNVVDVQEVDRTTGIITVQPTLSITPSTGQTTFAAHSTVFTNSMSPTSLPAPTDPRNDSLLFEASEPGAWGRDIEVTVTPQAPVEAKVALANDTDMTIKLQSQTPGFYPGAWIEVDRGSTKVFRRIGAVDNTGPTPVLTIDGYTNTDFDLETTTPPTLDVIVKIWELGLSVASGGVIENFNGLTLENVPGKFILDRLAGSTLVKVLALPMDHDPLHFPAPENGSTFRLDDGGFGADGSVPGATDYVGDLTAGAGDRTGIKALEDIDRISIIAAPGNVDVSVQNALIEQCERLKDRFAILDPKGTSVNDVTTQRQQFDTKYAAIYYPNLVTFDPVTGNNITVPPSGHMAGLYARVDIERGVHKAPANEVVRGIVDFAATINKETQDLLNPSPTNINVFRDFRADGRGLRIWGARVATSDTSWKYINVRRLFLFLEESIDEGTQWVVFEPNDAPLWARVTQSISAFLTRVWRDGALQGATAEEAFFVKCDRTTMTQDDIDNGKLIAIVGVAPVKPAEFVIIRISQWTAGASAA